MLNVLLFFNASAMKFFGPFCAWLVLFFPFALWARKIARADALNGIEAFILGQACGPVGVWLVMRANRKAADRAYRQGLLNEELRKPDHLQSGQAPNVIAQPLVQPVLDTPGGRAFRTKHDLRPVVKQEGMQQVGLSDPVRPEPPAREPGPPLEPPAPPLKKAAGAWQAPPADYKFTHSDEDAARGGDKPGA